jgi:hypothetical protein
MGLGALSEVDVTKARSKASALKVQVKERIDPLEKRNRENEAAKLQQSTAVSFAEVASEYIDSH